MKSFKIYIFIYFLLGITVSMIMIPSITYKYLETYTPTTTPTTTPNPVIAGKLIALQTYLDDLNENMKIIISNFKSIYMNHDDFSKPGTLIYNLYRDMINIRPIANAINNTLQITTEKDPKLVDQPVITADYRWTFIQDSVKLLKERLNTLQTNMNTYLGMVPDPIPSSYTTTQIETIPLLNNLKVDIILVNSRLDDLSG